MFTKKLMISTIARGLIFQAYARRWRQCSYEVGERPRTDELLPNVSDVGPRGVQRLPVPHEAGGKPRVLQLR